MANIRKYNEYKLASFLKSGLISGGWDITTIILLNITANKGKLPPAIIAKNKPRKEYNYFYIRIIKI